jgi:predicted anti-sigma-YlaC factor YlaD
MRCVDVRTAVSTELDGEQVGIDAGFVRAHLAVCPDCHRFAAGTRALDRSVRVRLAEPVPDLSDSVFDAICTERSRD